MVPLLNHFGKSGAGLQGDRAQAGLHCSRPAEVVAGGRRHLLLLHHVWEDAGRFKVPPPFPSPTEFGSRGGNKT